MPAALRPALKVWISRVLDGWRSVTDRALAVSRRG